MESFVNFETVAIDTVGPPFYSEAMANAETPASFEASLKELEKIAAELEKGDTPLEAQFAAFEKGILLSRQCFQKLEEVERKVETLVRGADGKIEPSPFPE